MRLEFHEFELRLRHWWEISGGGVDTKRNAFVQIEEGGITGHGEAAYHGHFGESPETVRADLERAAASMKPDKAWDLDALGLTGSSRAALEMALLDLEAKQSDQTLGAMLGVPAPTAPIMTSFSIGIDRPERMAEKTAEAAGFAVLKVKVGTENDRANVTAVRSATEAAIRVDANGGWETRDEAARMIDWLAALGGVELIEQPLPAGRLEDTAWLRERSPLPIVLDEEVRVADDIAALAGACDGINIKLMKSGGLREAVRMIDTAREHGLKVMIGCMIESSLANAAALHLVSRADWADLDGHLLIANDPYYGITLTDGALVVPSGPGIGVHPVTKS